VSGDVVAHSTKLGTSMWNERELPAARLHKGGWPCASYSYFPLTLATKAQVKRVKICFGYTIFLLIREVQDVFGRKVCDIYRICLGP
jgi:hypothetical protein